MCITGEPVNSNGNEIFSFLFLCYWTRLCCTGAS